MTKKEKAKSEKKEAIKKINKKLIDAACELMRNLAKEPNNFIKHFAIFELKRDVLLVQRGLIIITPIEPKIKNGGIVVKPNNDIKP